MIRDKTSASIIWTLEHAIKSNMGVKPKLIKSDNGAEFTSLATNVWALDNDIEWLYGRPYTPQDQGAVEALNRYIKKLVR